MPSKRQEGSSAHYREEICISAWPDADYSLCHHEGAVGRHSSVYIPRVAQLVTDVDLTMLKIKSLCAYSLATFRGQNC